MIVVDASVAVKWVTGEQDRELANELLAGSEPLAGPFLLRTEVVAALSRKARFGEITHQDARDAAALWERMISGELNLIAEDADLSRSLELSLEVNHPLQDCIYLALAERLDAALVTADSKFVQKVRQAASAGTRPGALPASLKRLSC